MVFIARHAGLMVAGLLTLLLALTQYRDRAGDIAPAPPVSVVAAPQPPAAVVKAKKKPRRKLTAKAPAPPPPPVKARGERLRDKGEAFGGGTPDRVDLATGARTSP